MTDDAYIDESLRQNHALQTWASKFLRYNHKLRSARYYAMHTSNDYGRWYWHIRTYSALRGGYVWNEETQRWSYATKQKDSPQN